MGMGMEKQRIRRRCGELDNGFGWGCTIKSVSSMTNSDFES